MTPERIVISGATGFLGRRLVQTLLEKRREARLVLLARESKGQSAAQRMESIVREVCAPDQQRAALARMEILSADVSRERCGLAESEHLSVASGATRVIHAAATVRFDHPIQEARRINVGGTRNMLALAEEAHRRGSLKSFTYIGTAFVAGLRGGLVREDELEASQRFRNTYEQSKCEAEKLVRSRMPGLPAVIVRPSIIVGDSQTGMTTSFKALYWPLKVYARGWWRTVPGFPEAVLDIVPVDFVAEAAAHLAFEDRALGRSFHLCAGPGGSATIGEIADFAAAFFGLPPPRFVNPRLFFALLRPILLATLWGRRRRILRTGRLYRSHFRTRSVFDTTQADELLGPAGIHPPRVLDYLEKLFRYCVESDWGRRPAVPRAAI